MGQFLFEDLVPTPDERDALAAQYWSMIEEYSDKYMDAMDEMMMRTMAEDQVSRWYLGGTGKYIGIIDGGAKDG